MAERTILSWNVPNVVSVWLMAMAGFLAAGLIVQLVQSRMPSQGSNTGGGY